MRRRLDWKAKRVLSRAALVGRRVRFANFFQNDNVAIFPELRLAVNRIKKSGNTSLVMVLDDICAGANQTTTSAVKDRRQIHAARFSDIARLRFYRTLVVVRSPYTRALSGYLEKVGFGLRAGYAAYPGFGEISTDGFERFLLHLRANSRTNDRHFWRQSDLLFQPLENYSCVARLETIVDDMRGFLPVIGVAPDVAERFAVPHALERQEVGKITDSARRGDLLSARAREIIEDLYAPDFDAFGYPRHA